MSSQSPPTMNQAQTPQPPAQGQAAQPQTGQSARPGTYIPVPVPVIPTQKPSFGGTALGLLMLIVLGLLMRFLWRLPERFADRDWVQQLGGPYALQNRVLHALGYVSVLLGLATQELLLGIGVAAILMVASNVRPQGNGRYES